jgi:hypothetical protein
MCFQSRPKLKCSEVVVLPSAFKNVVYQPDRRDFSGCTAAEPQPQKAATRAIYLEYLSISISISIPLYLYLYLYLYLIADQQGVEKRGYLRIVPLC